MNQRDAFTGAVTVIGGGTMGQGIATATLQAGLSTTVVDVNSDALDRARAAVTRRIERAFGAKADDMLAGLTTSTDLEDAVSHADVVIEAVPELPDLKINIFTRLAAAASETALLVSNTSTLSILPLAEACAGSNRVIGMHFFNPAHKMPLVEIVVPSSASEATLRDALALAAGLGKDPVVVKDVPGFVTSRLGLLLGTEAMRMVEEGVASASDIDKAMRLGYGHPMGPLELADLVGLDARLNNLRSMHERSGSDQYLAPGILERLVEMGRLGKKTGSGFFEYDSNGSITGPGQLP
jgi:3-hydroxybutyryl-CoA dehydrogenase